MNKMDGFIKTLCHFCLICIIALGLFSVVGTCGGGGGDGGTETTGAGSDIIKLKAVMGPIIGASVWVAPLNDTDNILATGTTEDSEDINDAGHVSIEIPSEYPDTPLYIEVSGGVDIDVDDDGVRDTIVTDNDIRLDFIVPTPADLKGMSVVINPLLLFASNLLTDTTCGGSSVPGYDPCTDPEVIKTAIRRIARALIEEDIDGDGKVGWEDIIKFHPLIDQGKSLIPWDSVLDDVTRRRQEYSAAMNASYNRTYYLDPQSRELFDFDGDGDWRDETSDQDMLAIGFCTNKNDYTTKDLLDGQGFRGGKVTLPQGAKISYRYREWNEDDWQTVEDDPEPPLWIDWEYLEGGAHNICAAVGGQIFEPSEVPVGDYTINYKTGDGQEHQEIVYMHEHRSETFFI